MSILSAVDIESRAPAFVGQRLSRPGSSAIPLRGCAVWLVYFIHGEPIEMERVWVPRLMGNACSSFDGAHGLTLLFDSRVVRPRATLSVSRSIERQDARGDGDGR